MSQLASLKPNIEQRQPGKGSAGNGTPPGNIATIAGSGSPGYTLLDADGVAKKLRVSRSAVYRAVAEGSLPHAVRIGKRSVRWISEELDAWLGANCPPAAIWRTIRHRFGFGASETAA